MNPIKFKEANKNLLNIIKEKLNKLFRKNCYDCKHYKLYDVASYGDRCRYKCIVKNRINHHSINNKSNYVKCKSFRSDK